MRAAVLLVVAVLAVPLPPAAAAQTGTWEIAVRPGSGGTADYAAEAGHAATADTAATAGHATTADSAAAATTATSATAAATATSADTAAALSTDPAACPPGQYVTDVAAAGALSCSSPPSGGDVYGPSSATDNAVARYDGATGKLLQGSSLTVSDTGAVQTAIVTGTGEIAMRLRTGYNDGSKPLSIWNSGVGEVLFLDSIGTMYLNSQFGVGSPYKVTLYPFGSPYVAVSSSGAYKWSSSTTSATVAADTSLTRSAAGVVQVQDLLRLTPLATSPACDSSSAGRIYHDTAPGLCWCNGAAWVLVAGVGPCA